MRGSRQLKRSDLFLVRLWAREAGDGETELRGKVQRAVGGEVHYFSDLPELADLLRTMMPGALTGAEAQLPDPDITEP